MVAELLIEPWELVQGPDIGTAPRIVGKVKLSIHPYVKNGYPFQRNIFEEIPLDMFVEGAEIHFDEYPQAKILLGKPKNV